MLQLSLAGVVTESRFREYLGFFISGGSALLRSFLGLSALIAASLSSTGGAHESDAREDESNSHDLRQAQ